MNTTTLSILNQYWGFKEFRPLQEDIINSVLSGNDTLALLPTGGGKSICFQVPALKLAGVCIVISPLIALMKDQVENLRALKIKAVAIYSGMNHDEVLTALDNCIYGDYKFLYLSPERLLSELVRDKIEKMNVSFFTVDEAHCISQWGYDFRPSYLQIAQIRTIHPAAAVLALTATATHEVKLDIMKQLSFKKDVVFQKSFERKNLSYLVYHCEDKESRLLEILSKTNGSGIVYVRSRKRSREYADFLAKRGISADCYHAGLTGELRNHRQKEWKAGNTRIMVCTNAFGMGIDKPDVRVVIHLDIPDNPESYYQEAGRAGRDERDSFAVILYNKTDVADLKSRQKTAFPPVKEIKKIYQGIANYLQIPVDSGMGVSYDFDISLFANSYNMNPVTVINCIKVLESEGFFTLTDAAFMPSRLHIKVNNIELYNFQVVNKSYDLLLKTILRSYEGIFEDFVRINESEIANRSKLAYKEVVRMLNYMHDNSIVSYQPRKDQPQLTLTLPREDAKYLTIDQKGYEERRKRYLIKSAAMINYVESKQDCRSMMLLRYFGEKAQSRCGKCDYCRELNKIDLNQIELDAFKKQITSTLLTNPMSVKELIERSGLSDTDKALKMILLMIDQELIRYSDNGRLMLAD